MAKDRRRQLSEIKQFKQLITFLRDEMGWPINSDSEFEELTYEYTTAELGIDEKSAAQIQEIKRLRPLSPKQPWGVFFVKFEPKKLPVVALRRILGQVALKKRASANPADRTMWAQEDLLFISNYGEGDDRQISLAHFSVPTRGHTLPSLKVLGWDSKDTVLHLEAVARELTEQLSWPDNENDVDAWRAQWRAAFTLGHREVITTSKALSIRLAQLARDIRDRISTALTIETEDGPLTKLMKAFQQSLIHDLTPEDFADMYAQTIAYGLLSSRIADPKKKSVDDLAVHMRLSPFLKELMETFIKIGGRHKGAGLDFDELGVGDLIDLLDQANMEAVVADFGDKNPQEDPVIHFYELFLKEYDAKKRMSRGVFYTPRPVVSYIVRSVDELLRTELGLSDGLADTTSWAEMAARHSAMQIPAGVSLAQDFVQILDPATGTGTFLVEIVEVIYKTLVTKWTAQGYSSSDIEKLWNDYVPKHLLTRLHGYELLMAPYTIAQLKLALKLHETGYDFHSNERARVFLTNSLEPITGGQLTLGFMPALANESEAVQTVKRDRRFTVIVGNPPYSGVSSNMNPWVDKLIKGRSGTAVDVPSYYEVNGAPLGERKVWLQDDYVKFMCLAQWIIATTGIGIQGYITNHGYLDNPTFRGMRWSLIETFTQLSFVDLHGNVMRRENPASTVRDENVFDIQQGVAITTLVKAPWLSSSVRLANYWGTRESKYELLAHKTPSQEEWRYLSSLAPDFLFAEYETEGVQEYFHWPSLTDIFPKHSTGVITAHDQFAIDVNPRVILERIDRFLDFETNDDEVALDLGIKDNAGWKIPTARRKLADSVRGQNLDSFVRPIMYRPFDQRQIFWHKSVVWNMREAIMNQVIKHSNLGLIFMRQVASGDDYSHFGVSDVPVEGRAFYSNKGIMSFAPLMLFPEQSKGGNPQPNLGFQAGVANLSSNYLERLERSLGSTYSTEGAFLTHPGTFGPRDVLNWIYATVHSNVYRERYGHVLKRDYPRVPIPRDPALWGSLIRFGEQLIQLHLGKERGSRANIAEEFGEVMQIEKVVWADGAVFIDAAQSAGFKSVDKVVWEFRFGGYQVCEKWLKDRKGSLLSAENIAHYRNIVGSLSKTISLMRSIDDEIDQHGGWPVAFDGPIDNKSLRINSSRSNKASQ